jgi:hypothetical protein
MTVVEHEEHRRAAPRDQEGFLQRVGRDPTRTRRPPDALGGTADEYRLEDREPELVPVVVAVVEPAPRHRGVVELTRKRRDDRRLAGADGRADDRDRGELVVKTCELAQPVDEARSGKKPPRWLRDRELRAPQLWSERRHCVAYLPIQRDSHGGPPLSVDAAPESVLGGCGARLTRNE